jgi:AcrR family transcriptional regulator
MSLFAEFKSRFEQDEEVIWRQIFVENKGTIKIKKEKFALRNLQLIVTSTIELSNRSGFRAMSLRDLSNDTGISMGAIYSYIESKKRLMEIILAQVLHLVDTTLGAEAAGQLEPRERLRWMLRNHIFLSEVMQPWFFFAYMEAKSFDRVGKHMAIANELRTESLIASCLIDGERSGAFRPVDPTMTASLIKPLLQDWYLKRWKYGRRGIDPDAYAEWVISFVEAFLHPQQPRNGMPNSRAREAGATPKA